MIRQMTALALLPSVGCATILTGTKQKVYFESEPPSAIAKVDEQTLETPGELVLARDKSYDVEVSKPGYITAHGRIEQESNWYVLGDLALGGLFGGWFFVLIDKATGGAFWLKPTTLRVTLEKDPGEVASSLEPPPSEPGPPTQANEPPSGARAPEVLPGT